MKTLKLTQAILDQLGRVERASALYPNADEGFSRLEIEKLALADAIVGAVAEQQARTDRLPDRSDGVVYVTLMPRAKRKGER